MPFTPSPPEPRRPARREPPSPSSVRDFFGASQREVDVDGGANAHGCAAAQTLRLSDVAASATVSSPFFTGTDAGATDIRLIEQFAAAVMHAEEHGLLVPALDSEIVRRRALTAERRAKRRRERCHQCAAKLRGVEKTLKCSCGHRFCMRHLERPAHACTCARSMRATPLPDATVADKIQWRV